MTKENKVMEWRKKLLISRSELARRTGLSVVTIARIESGKPCRMDTMKKILIGLGFSVEEKNKVFTED